MALPGQDRKVFPAYGKELAVARGRGLVPKLPGGFLGVVLGWELHGVDPDSFPRVVVPTDRPMHGYQFGFLAGLTLWVFYRQADWRLARDLVGELLAARPRFLGSQCLVERSEQWGFMRCHNHEHEVIDGLTNFQAVPVFDDEGRHVRI
jgi:hypothetical protein